MEQLKDLGLAVHQKLKIGKESILVVDDSEDLLEIERIVLEMEGFEVFSAQSGKNALKILREINQPVLILVDVQMAEMSGFDFLKLLKQEHPHIAQNVPIVFLTGVNQIPMGEGVGFIRKPFEINTYLKAVHQFIEMGKHIPSDDQKIKSRVSKSMDHS